MFREAGPKGNTPDGVRGHRCYKYILNRPLLPIKPIEGALLKYTGSHFNLPGHSQANIKITVLERVKKEDKNYREVRESYLINKFNTYDSGMNKKK